MRPQARSFVALCAAIIVWPTYVAAQAFTPPERVGAVTVAWQFIDNTGHWFTDGFFLPQGQSISTSAFVDVDYGVTNRLAASVAIPYVFAKYTGGLPSFSRLPIDECRCWQSSFQDFSFGLRYRLGDNTWAVTPHARYIRPTHDYAYAGEAVVGRNLQELQVGVSAGRRLGGVLRKASLHGEYTYAFVQKPLRDISINRSNLSFETGYALTERLYLRGGARGQRTHGGVHPGSPTGNPFPLPGELNTPERFAQRDRLISARSWHAVAGLSYSAGPVDVFMSVTKYVWGRDAHNGQAYTVGSTWYFDLLQ